MKQENELHRHLHKSFMSQSKDSSDQQNLVGEFFIKAREFSHLECIGNNTE